MSTNEETELMLVVTSFLSVLHDQEIHGKGGASYDLLMEKTYGNQQFQTSCRKILGRQLKRQEKGRDDNKGIR